MNESSSLDQNAELMSWKGTNFYLQTRIRVLLNKQHFSVREMKQMRRLIRENIFDSEFDFEDVIYHFPGKSRKNIIQT